MDYNKYNEIVTTLNQLHDPFLEFESKVSLLNVVRKALYPQPTQYKPYNFTCRNLFINQITPIQVSLSYIIWLISLGHPGTRQQSDLANINT